MPNRIKQTQTQTQKLTPQQILQANIMQLNNTLLEQRIIKELEDNPTLEIIDDEMISDEETSEDLEDDESEFDWEELDSDSERFEIKKTNNKSSPDFLVTNHSAPKTLSDKINQQLIDINLNEDQMIIAHEIVGNLDDDGYFKIEPILIADRLGKTEQEVLDVLDVIQTLDPRGIASRDLRECMLLQISRQKNPLSYDIVDKYFDDFTNKRYEKIADKLDCTLDELKQAIEQIKKLNPKPGDGESELASGVIIPDLIMEKRVDEWVIHMNDKSMYELRINDDYNQILKKESKDKKAARFIKDKMNLANWFINAINQRKKTILSVMRTIVKKQGKIFLEDKHELEPMILKDIADELSIDISTVSRVTNGKYVQLPWGIIELRDFFSESIKMISGEDISNTVAKERIKDIILKEDKTEPLDDQEITDILTSDGFIIARRTVAKYRNSLGIQKSKLRREIAG